MTTPSKIAVIFMIDPRGVSRLFLTDGMLEADPAAQAEVNRLSHRGWVKWFNAPWNDDEIEAWRPDTWTIQDESRFMRTPK